MADQVNYNDGKWHGWNGGKCPVHPESVVEVVGICDVAAYAVGEHQEAGRVYWDDGSDIIAFRVIKEHKEPREFWVNEYPQGSFGELLESKEEADQIGGRSRIRCIRLREVID